MPSTAWTEILSASLSFGQSCRVGGNRAWFRGHRNADWELKSTLHRYVDDKLRGAKIPAQDELELRTHLLRAEAKSLYLSFKTEAWPLLSEGERSDWGLLFTMQHFSLPTRLLDWTESFACAVYFAQVDRQPSEQAAIWMLDPTELNRLGCGFNQMLALDSEDRPAVFNAMRWHPGKLSQGSEPLTCVAAVPIYTNARMVQQKSRFTLMGDSFLPLDQQWEGKLVQGGYLKKLILPPETFKDVEDFLYLSGINAFSFFPDLQGLGVKHKEQGERDKRLAREAFPEFFNVT